MLVWALAARLANFSGATGIASRESQFSSDMVIVKAGTYVGGCKPVREKFNFSKLVDPPCRATVIGFGSADPRLLGSGNF